SPDPGNRGRVSVGGQQRQKEAPSRKETKPPVFAIIKKEESNAVKKSKEITMKKERQPFLPPILPAARRRSTTINIPVNMSRSRSSPNCSSRMRFGRPPHSPDGRNQLTRLFYLPLIPPRSTSSHQWPGNDIDRVIRALAS
ncbi:hypothetical protein PFISCL1PPCAC_26268, partial [Pristionchus fissidentatus]